MLSLGGGPWAIVLNRTDSRRTTRAHHHHCRQASAEHLELRRLLTVAPANDDPANAQLITGMPTADAPLTAEVLLTNATRADWESRSQFPGDYSVWYTWTPSADGKYALSVSNNVYTQISIFTAQSNARGISDYSHAVGLDEIAFLGTTATTYVFRVSHVQSIAMPLTLTISNATPAANDDFADRVVLPHDQTPATPTVLSGSIRQATCEPGENYFPTWQPPSVWYEWTAPANITVRFDLAGEALRYELYTSPSGSGTLASLSSVANPTEAHAVTAGTTYYLRVRRDYQVPDTTFTLTVRNMSVVANDDFATRQTLLTGVPTSGTTIGATLEPGEHVLHRWAAPQSVWYQWTATEDALARAATDWQVGRYVGIYEYRGTGEPTMSGLSLLTHGYGQSGWNAQAGHTYYVQVVPPADAFWSDFTIDIGTDPFRPTSDNFTNALVVDGANRWFYASNIYGTLGADEPFEFAGPDGTPLYAERVIWFIWRAPATATAKLLVDNEVAGLGVYTGDSPDSLHQVTSAMRTGGEYVDGEYRSPTVVTFDAVADQVYRFAMGTYRSSSGTFYANLMTTAQAPTHFSLSSTRVPAGSPPGTVVGAFSGSDPDPGHADTLTYAYGPNREPDPNFAIIGNELRTLRPLTAGTTHHLWIRASDPEGLSYLRMIPITVTTPNTAPVLTDVAMSITENLPTGTAVINLTATDANLPADTLTYAITDGNEDGRFALDPATGQLTLTGPLDYETRSSYALTITVTDNGTPALSTTATVTMAVTDLQEFGLQSGKLQKLRITDTDGDSVTFSLTGGGFGSLQPLGRLIVLGTTPKSILTIAVRKSSNGDGYYTLNGIVADGPLKRLAAARVLFTGGIHLNTNDAPVTTPVALTLAAMHNGTLNTHGQPINTLKLKRWQDSDQIPDQLLAPWIGSIAASDDWQADILTTSSNRVVALGSLTVGGSLGHSTINATGTLKRLTVRGAIANSRILATDGLTSLSAASLENSDILVGISPDLTDRYASTFANPAAKLSRLTITGRKLPRSQTHPAYVTNSHISAPLYGTITLTNVPAETGPILHVLTDTGALKLKGFSPDMLPSGTWRATHPPKPTDPPRPSLVDIISY